MKIGMITVGQSPRVDVMADIAPLFDPDTLLLQRGALDGMTQEELQEITPEEGDYVLVSRLNNGQQVRFAERKIIPKLQAAITSLETDGVSCILMLCTGKFPPELKSNVRMIYPYDLLTGLVPILSGNGHIAVILPDESQIPQLKVRWEQLADQVTLIAASPYGDLKEVLNAGEKLKDCSADLIILDCIGYTSEMKEMIRTVTKKPVLLPRTLLARVAVEYSVTSSSSC